jgi:hypothetical protein
MVEEVPTKTRILNLLNEAFEICLESDHPDSNKISAAVEISAEFFQRWSEETLQRTNMDNQSLINRLKDAPLDLKVYTNYLPVRNVRSIYMKCENGVEIEVEESDKGAYQVLLIE